MSPAVAPTIDRGDFTSGPGAVSNGTKGAPPAMNRVLASLLLALPLVAVSSGCRLGKEDTDTPADGEGSGEVSSDEQALVADGSDMEVAAQHSSALAAIPSLAVAAADSSSVEAAVDAQEAAASFFQPEGCLTVTKAGNVVTYVFDGCTGPWGLVEVNGTETATFRQGPEAGSIAVALQSEGLTLNEVAIEHQADVVVTFPDGGKRVTWNGGFSGTTGGGRPIEHTSDLVWTVDADGCRTTNGTTSGSIGERGLTTTYEELVRCGGLGTCAAGSISSTSRSGLTVSLEMDGSGAATFTGPRGREWEIDLACEPSGS